ncbi:peptidase domain-containing ABC transporter [uncultured Tenacibaculum sp.]|uniref:peptidase domain-containing ABC transporter n=1 Tax=uncultured Tenacibaculum sp. TaxID=174713 RepID=UPI002631BC47|nr:peptidase domain-containing ABC transporter [uncultured Tenacibaculum sp.]
MNFPFFKQLDAMDCGPASLKIISKFYGKIFSMKYLRDKCNITREGVSLKDISRVAENLGLRTLPLKVNYDDLLNKIPLPCILHWNYNHFVVVYKVKKNKIYVSDPQVGLVTYNREEFEHGWKKNNEKGIVLVIEPGAEFSKKEDIITNNVFSNYLLYLKPHKKILIQVFFGMLMGIVISLIFPFITQSIVDIGIETQDFDFINILLVAMVVLTISSVFSSYVQSRMMLYVADRVNISMVSDFIQKTLKLPVSFYERKMTSDILNRINDHNRIQKFILNSFLGIIVATLSFIVYAVILAFYDISLFLFFLMGTILYVLWILLFLKRRRVLDHKYFDSNIYNQNEIIQIAESSSEIKINNLEQKKRWDWEKSRFEIYGLNIKLLNLSQTQNIGTTIIDRLKNVFITYFAAKAVIDGSMTLGMMLSAQYIIGQMNGPVGQLINFIQSYQDAKISLERVNEVVHEEEEELVFEGYEMPVPKKESIRLNKVSFKYHESTPNVLSDIDVEIPYGKMIAIVGQSGSGKTTLMKLLLRLYQDYEGEITMGATNFKAINVHEWRKRCGVVMQEGKIFNDNIITNIVLDTDSINTDKLQKAIRLANLESFINDLPQKLYTVIGQGGNGISGGQKQRVLIARAIYKDPDFFFFDEATNSLDTKNEKEITENLQETISGKTTVVIAHRLSTVKSADVILVLDKGKIVEQGNHKQLVKKKGVYHSLVSNQIELDS